MYTAWTKHIKDQEEKIKFQNQVLAAKPVLEHLIRLMREDEEAQDAGEMNVKSFDTPNWDYKQAFRNGYRAHRSLITKLINLDQQEIPSHDQREPTRQ